MLSIDSVDETGWDYIPTKEKWSNGGVIRVRKSLLTEIVGFCWINLVSNKQKAVRGLVFIQHNTTKFSLF